MEDGSVPEIRLLLTSSEVRVPRLENRRAGMVPWEQQAGGSSWLDSRGRVRTLEVSA